MLDDERPGARLAAERVELALAGEHDVRRELLEPREQPVRAEVGDPSGRGEVDADPGTLRPRRAGRARSRLRDRAVEHRVPGHVADVALAQPADVDLLGAELRARASVGEHRALVGAVDHRDHDAAGGRHDGTDELDAARGDLVRCETRCAVVAALCDQSCLRAERSRPGRDVRGLPARGYAGCRRRVVARGGRSLEPHDHVE